MGQMSASKLSNQFIPFTISPVDLLFAYYFLPKHFLKNLKRTMDNYTQPIKRYSR